jgi:hypothetical protein
VEGDKEKEGGAAHRTMVRAPLRDGRRAGPRVRGPRREV